MSIDHEAAKEFAIEHQDYDTLPRQQNLSLAYLDLHEQLELAANNTAAADLAQDMEFLRAEKDARIEELQRDWKDQKDACEAIGAENERLRQAFETEHKMKCIALDDRDAAREQLSAERERVDALAELHRDTTFDLRHCNCNTELADEYSRKRTRIMEGRA